MLKEQMQIFFRLADEASDFIRRENLTLEDLVSKAPIEVAYNKVGDYFYGLNLVYCDESEPEFVLYAMVMSSDDDEQLLIMAQASMPIQGAEDLRPLLNDFKDAVENKHRAVYGFTPITRRSK